MAELDRLVARYREVLTEDLGVSPRAVDEATLAFEAAGLNMLLFLEERDPEYLHLVAMFPPPEQEVEHAELVRLCNQVTREAKVAKVVLDEEGDLIVSAEMIVAGTDLVPSRAQLTAVLPRATAAVFNAVNKISTSLELLGIARAVYDGQAEDTDGLDGEDDGKQPPAKRQHRHRPPPAQDGGAGD